MDLTSYPYNPLPPYSGASNDTGDGTLPQLPVHIVTHASQLPPEFLNPSLEKKFIIGFDCEGVDLCRHGILCIMQALYFQHGSKLHNVMDTQIAYSLLEEQEGRKRSLDDYISFVDLLADSRYCGISYLEKEEVRVRLRQAII